MSSVRFTLTNQYRVSLAFSDGNAGPTDSIVLTLREALKGDKGDPGTASSRYDHTQATPASVWTINHGLGIIPVVISVLTSAGDLVEGDITFPDANTVIVKFSGEFSGSAHIT